MTLSKISILLGVEFLAPALLIFFAAELFKRGASQFPRSILTGYVLMGGATIWFLCNLNQEQTADFLAYKNPMMMGFGAVGVLTCIYVTDFLSIRGLAVLLMLGAKEMLDSARWVDTQWRLLISTLAYLMILGGMWWTIAPWRFRDLLNWAIGDPDRLKLIGGIFTGIGALLVALGFTVFRD
ncbi:MAG: hypothetical protein ACI9VS_002372 [Candidatus Binatia bacterium]|jgi:hypothetical protein